MDFQWSVTRAGSVNVDVIRLYQMLRFGLKTLLFITAIGAVVVYVFNPAPPLTLETLPNAQPTGELQRLAVGFRGNENRVANNDSVTDLSSSGELEFTHALVSNTSATGIRRELVVGISEPNNTRIDTLRAPTVLLTSIPKFEVVEQLTTIEEFEQIFGKSGDFKDGWGGNGSWHSSENWRGCVIIDDHLRVVSVFAQTSDTGDGWHISSRTIREGTYRSTGKKPKPERDGG